MCSFSIGQGNQRRIVVGSTAVITRCCLPYRCVHEKSVKISKVLEKPVDCICLSRLKSLSFSFPIEDSLMPSSSMKYVENESTKKLLKPSERRQNVTRSAFSDRQKRPDMQIYVPRALRDTQKKCFPIESKIESESDKSSIDENERAISDERTLCSENEVDVQVPQPVNFAGNVENSSHTKLPHNKTVADCTYLEKEDVSNTSSYLLTDKQNIYCEKSETPSCSHTFEINILHNQTLCQKIKVFPQIVTENTNTLPISNESALSFQDSEAEITNSSITSEDICANSDENLLKSPTRTNVSEALPVDKSSEYPFQEKEDSWESKFDDDGECLNPEVFKDLKSITGQVEVLVVKNKYTDFMPASDSINEGYDSIVELYDFPREFNTQDLVSAFSQFQQSSYSIKWVDDCHALAIFSSPCIANQALMLNNPFVKTRPISEGIKESKEKAKWCERHSEPVKPRPTTSAVLARRLVSGALGLKVQASKEQRDQERTILKEAKEKRRLKAKQKQAIWDGIVL